ncbi:hypothetical protein ACPV4O_15965 [Vibrio owensii]|uniref:hypothetical protein n=1 Tax=Vibrio owensii TaxID=696485 RepID=UPI004067B92A
MPKDKTTRAEQFIIKAKEKYGDLYDYSKVDYLNQNTYVQIICLVHGSFYTSPKNFLAANKKVGCPVCYRQSRQSKLSQKQVPKAASTKGCNTNNFNVCGNASKHKHLLCEVFR